ncbi:MAG: response regulator [Sediminicola sp.]|tara:strand:- start:25430 stop:25846 length:417 start_codon:yes stop_codon:yes gene_type:complete
MQKLYKGVLFAEDDEDDRVLFEDAVKESFPNISMTGYDRCENLLQDLMGSILNLPELIFLDLNMPGMNGLDCLRAIRESAKFKHIPVIMLSTSSSEMNIKESMSLGANGYITKPSSFLQLRTVLEKSISEFVDRVHLI